MRPLIVGAVLGVAALTASTAGAQLAPRAGQIEIAPYAGYMVFGNMVDGPLGTSLRTSDAPLFGAQLGVTITPAISLVGNAAYSNTSIEARVPFLGGVELADSKIWMFDGGLQIGLSPSARTSPFVQVGAGVMRHAITVGPVSTDATNFALNAGVGLDVHLANGVAMRLMAKDYYGKFDFEEAALVDVGGDRTHNFALTAGLKIGF